MTLETDQKLFFLRACKNVLAEFNHKERVKEGVGGGGTMGVLVELKQ